MERSQSKDCFHTAPCSTRNCATTTARIPNRHRPGSAGKPPVIAPTPSPAVIAAMGGFNVHRRHAQALMKNNHGAHREVAEPVLNGPGRGVGPRATAVALTHRGPGAARGQT